MCAPRVADPGSPECLVLEAAALALHVVDQREPRRNLGDISIKRDERVKERKRVTSFINA